MPKPRIEIFKTDHPVYPFVVIENGYANNNSFATYQEAHNYRDDLKKWHRAKKAVDA